MLRVLSPIARGDKGPLEASGGDSFIAAVEFSRPPRAKVLMVAGNTSDPGSPHYGDQLSLYQRKRMRDAWRTRPEIEAHLSSRTVFRAGGAVETRPGTPAR